MTPLALLAASPITWAKRAALAALVGGMGVLYVQLLAERTAHANTRTAHANHQSETALSTLLASEAARAKEATLLAATTALREQLHQEKRSAKANQDRLIADIRAGAQRLSIAATCPAPPASQAGEDTAAAPGDGADSARAELDPEAAATLVAIAADGDQAIRERNACIAAYDNIRDTLNAR